MVPKRNKDCNCTGDTNVSPSAAVLAQSATNMREGEEIPPPAPFPRGSPRANQPRTSLRPRPCAGGLDPYAGMMGYDVKNLFLQGDTLFAATAIGLYQSADGGGHWVPSGFPYPTRALVFQGDAKLRQALK